MIRRPPRSTLDRSSAASDVYKRQAQVRQDPRLLALLLEALQRAFEVLVFVDDDFRQTGFPPFVAFVRRLGTE